jgi:imidazolonepropionase-like amidohydrolase
MRNLAKYLTPFLFAASFISMAHAENVAIVGGDVYTAHDGAVYEAGVVVISDDKIAAVGGADTPVPDGYRVIDATGKWVTPGMMNAYTQIGLEEVSLEPSTLNHSISETFYSAGFNVSDGINPETPIIPITRIEGVTRVVVAPGSGVPFDQNPNKSVFAGQAVVIHLGGGYDLVVKDQAAVVSYPGNAKVGGARTAVLDYLKGALREAAQPKGKKKKGASNGPARFAKAPEDKAILAKVVTGEVPLYINEDKASNILQLLALRDEFEDIRLIILGAAEGWIVADELAAANVPVVIAPTSNLPGGGFSSLGATLYNAGRLEAAGVMVAIVNGGFSSAHNARLLNQDAGNAVAHGMSWNGAFEAITINPAKIFGIDEDFGSLEAGKDADVVVWDGDPLEVMSSPDHVFIMGEEVPLVSRQTRLRDRYMDLGAEKDKPLAYKK